jgi:hypothetical protein
VPGGATPGAEGPGSWDAARHAARVRQLIADRPLTTLGPGLDPLFTRLGGLVDGLARRALEPLFALSTQRVIDAAGPGTLRSTWERHAAAAAQNPAPFFPRPPVPPLEARRQDDVPGGWIEEVTFPSAYGAGRDTAAEMARQFPENQTARARWYRHAAPGRLAVVCLHPWGAGLGPLTGAVFWARRLFARGLDVCLYVQPYHGPRAPRHTRPFDIFHPTVDATRVCEAFLQTVWEVRALLAWHAAVAGRGGGLVGMSLGAYAAALAASVAPELEFVVPIAPIADLAAMIWTWGARSAVRARFVARGMDFDRFSALMAVHSPLRYPGPVIPRERILIAAGRGDRFIPRAHVEALWEHWGQPALEWFPGGHVAQFGRRRTFARLEALLGRVAAAPWPPAPAPGADAAGAGRDRGP